MTIQDLQRRIGAGADGMWGPKSRAALLAYFTNKQANALSDGDIADAAARLGATTRQVRAVLKVEAAGRGFDKVGMPKILYERHLFHRMTGGRFSPAPFSQSQGGGYTTDANKNGILDSWERLCEAIATGEVDAAFQACSWGLLLGPVPGAGTVVGRTWLCAPFRAGMDVRAERGRSTRPVRALRRALRPG